ncbi:hypothetical protein [Sedimentisphaera salicampi]|uniref:Uncharacterized protein n=1 Tax=Sedimentisphaera salicampi TaxID=1941349 RepID=A0A1W6LKX2_9BACT|nr:hypothetical protein [Sedimentisphaera salicampi]ARN56440.1 hypothetical protein STSP1_00822 [Sedimentisphaera salicampi]
MNIKMSFMLRVFSIAVLMGGLALAAPPSLPSGLSDEGEKSSDSPSLPSGLGGESSEEKQSTSSPSLPSGLGGDSESDEQEESREDSQSDSFFDSGLTGLTGFLEFRSGWRLQNDEHQQDMSIGETRLQLEMEKYWEGITFAITSDIYYDWAYGGHRVDLERGEGFLDLREANLLFSPADFVDIKAGRQVLTWGTGDLIFINDMFPKDWQSFFSGRDTEYLKAPSDAAKASFYTDIANVDVVYTPRFDSDRFINGERNSYWNGMQTAGEDSLLRTEKPDQWFRDDEWAVRVSKNVQGYELAAYGYWGYWKSPSGQIPSTGEFTFNDLNVYGASVRGQVGAGIGNIELGYYDSRDDQDGDDPFAANSQMRYLVGYEQDLPQIASDLTAAVQFYVEQTMRYESYEESLPPGQESTIDQYRQLLTFRITKLYFNQNLTTSLFTYFSPSDKDVYMRPNIHYKVDDNLAVEAGANIFWGDYPYTFFGQFRDNTNIYTAVRYSF